MTVTETATDSTEAEVTQPVPPVIPEQLGGFAGVLGSGDHKTIGKLFIFTSLLFGVVAGVTGVLLGLEQTDTSGIDIVPAADALQIYDLHLVSTMFLFVIPLLLGLAIHVVPLQIGAATVAFPRAAAASFWGYLVSGAIVLAAYAAEGGAFGSDADGVALYVAAMVVLLASLTLAAVCVGATGFALRAEGMSMRRTPLFTWANIAASVIWVLSLPVLAGVLILVYLDLRYGNALVDGVRSTDPGFLGGAGGIHRRVAWFWSQPTVFAVAIPLLGILADIAATAGRTRFFQHRIAIFLIGDFALLSFGVWAMPGFGPEPTDATAAYVNEIPYWVFSFAVVAPVLALVGLVALTLQRSERVQVTAGLLWSAGAVLMLLAGAGNAALVSIDQLDLAGTTAQTSQTTYVVYAAVLAAFGGISHWSSKLFGRQVPEGASKLLALGGLGGVVLAALPDLVSGFLGQPTFGGVVVDDVSTVEGLNAVVAAGDAILLAVLVGFALLLVKTATSGPVAESDPWGGNTLEWAAASPPVPGNFASIPAITSEAPLYDARHAKASN